MWHWARPLAESLDQYNKTLALAEKLGDRDAEGYALYHLAVHCLYTGDLRGTLAYAERCRALVPVSDSSVIQVMGPGMTGIALHNLGENARAWDYIDPIVNRDYTLAPRDFRTNSAAARLASCGLVWVMGFPDRAMDCVGIAFDEVKAMKNPMMICNLLVHAICPPALYVGNLAAVEDWVAELLDISAKSGLARWHAIGQCLKGQLLAIQGDYSGLELLRGGLDRLHAVGFAYRYGFFLGALAEGLGAAGRLAEAQAAIDEALACTERTEERWCLPELLRIKGELMRLDGAADAAEDCFGQSLDWAQQQGALSWELRTAISLARLWRQDGKAVAVNLLSAVYNRFTEGFETTDLKAAGALLKTLRTR
jgi:tetratricopeptide (TPR) repeat protein